MSDNSKPQNEDPYPSYLSPKLAVSPCRDGKGLGVFAAEPIAKGELLAIWGGRVIDGSNLAKLPSMERRYALQVGDDQFLTSLDHVDPPDYINHCCQPNSGVHGEDRLVAMRKIAVGEEVLFDYATTDSCSLLEFECGCRKRTCRGQVSSTDWMRSDVQARNRGHFSPYLQRRIDVQKRTGARGGAAPEGARVALRQSDS
ncbi:MAG: SET domain-containing protein [Alphaproteobacteria bacterium]|nr:SET domain-containing protein [Alphaproteobacteria bacterium]